MSGFAHREHTESRLPRADVTDFWTIPLDVAAWDQAAPEQTLSDEERARAARFVFDQHRRRFVRRRVALRSILASYLGIRPRDVEFRTTRFGKPWLPQASEQLSFSASHSHEVAIVAIATEGRLGADIEWVRELTDRDDVAQRFFTAGENREIAERSPGERTPTFFRCWTRKEAFVKALGLGLQYPLDRFNVPTGPLGDEALVDVDDSTALAVGTWTVRDLPVPAGYIGALVRDARGMTVEPLSWLPA